MLFNPVKNHQTLAHTYAHELNSGSCYCWSSIANSSCPSVCGSCESTLVMRQVAGIQSTFAVHPWLSFWRPPSGCPPSLPGSVGQPHQKATTAPPSDMDTNLVHVTGEAVSLTTVCLPGYTVMQHTVVCVRMNNVCVQLTNKHQPGATQSFQQQCFGV